jgi:hypothetical protein
MIGQKFDRLTVAAEPIRLGRRYKVLCVCVCGVSRMFDVHKVRSGHTRSCGCLLRELLVARQTKHGNYFEPEYLVWTNMHKRCTDARLAKWYGGVNVCDRWAEYKNFLEDVGRKPTPKHSLDRVDSAKDYAPGNVRWASRAVQSRNTKNHKTNTSGIRGVSWSKTKQKWRSAIYVDGRQKHIGYFLTLDEAASARTQAESTYWGTER